MISQKCSWMAKSTAVCFLLFSIAACERTMAAASGVIAQVASDLSSEESKQQRLAWNLKTLVEAYQSAGYTNPKWDPNAKQALTEFARSRSKLLDKNEPVDQIVSNNASAAIQSGCKDPMINYLFIKNIMNRSKDPKVVADAYCRTADDMQQSSYPMIRKFYASLRAAQHLNGLVKSVNGVFPPTPPEVHKYRRQAMADLASAVADKQMPVGEVDDACIEMMNALAKNSTQGSDFYRSIEKSLFNNWPDESISWLLKGRGYIQMAWEARGNGYADTVTDEGWKLFGERLAIAEESLHRARMLNPKDPRIAEAVLVVELGQGKGPGRLDMWFKRAMELNPNDYSACSKKLYYLEPKWHGSVEEMLQFGHECVTNKKWGGQVPLILVKARDSIQDHCIAPSEKDNYWKRPEVWADIKSAFERYFELNPSNTSWYSSYALHAYRAEQWDTLNKIIPKLNLANYDYFSGKDEYDKMVRLAKERSSKP